MRRLGRFLPIVMFAMLVQIFAPIEAFLSEFGFKEATALTESLLQKSQLTSQIHPKAV